MDVALIVVIAVLLLLVAFVALRGRGARRAAQEREEGEARVIAKQAKAQHEESEHRQAGVREAHAERTSESGRTPAGQDTP